MKLLLALAPTVLLVVFGQLVTKWRVQTFNGSFQAVDGRLARAWVYLTDPYVLAAYAAALAGSVAWVFVVERYAISVAFPLYIGITVLLVTAGGVVLMGEQLTTSRVIAVVLILTGVAIGARD
jgi:multidrug transporter EmrE-like cation transporter